MRPFPELLKATRKYAKEDRTQSWWHLLFTLAVLISCIAISAQPLALWIRILASLGAGLVTVRMFIIYHDYQHKAIFLDSPVAGFLLNTFGILVLNPPQVWKRSHNYHHQKNSQIATASIGSFPIMTTKEYERSSWPKRLGYTLARSPLSFVAGYFFIFIIGMCLKPLSKDPKRHFDSLVALLVHVALVISLARYDLSVLFLSYLFPLYIACGLGAYLFYIQHNFPDMKLRPREKWDFVFAALNASSYMEASPLMHWFTGNIGYHHVHHLNAQIPFYRLPEAMRGIPELQNPGRTSLHPYQIYRCLSLKLWDPDREKMLTFREYRTQQKSKKNSSRRLD